MLNEVTNYLLQYRHVTIPFIGSFELQYIPAQLDFASRLILPPKIKVVHTPNEDVEEQQLNYLSEANALPYSEVITQLKTLGNQLKSSINQQPFEWTGIGRLELNGSDLIFHSEAETKLSPVAAHKVMRENVSHAVTVGDKEIQSHDAGALMKNEPAKSYLMLIVWILVVLALLFIVYILYTNGFSPLSSGYRQQVGDFKSLTQLVS